MALPDTQKVSAFSNLDAGISSQTVSNGSSYTSSTVIDNTSNRNSLMVIEAVWSYTTAPTGSRTVEIYLLKSIDGTNYEAVAETFPLSSFSPPADTSSHRHVVGQDIPLLPCKYKLAVKNVDTQQTITITVIAKAYNMVMED